MDDPGTWPVNPEAERTPHPFDYISMDQAQDLWGIGYTIVKRSRHPDPFFVPPEMVPQSRSYQWMHLVHDQIHIERGWAAVPASRHDGYFMPIGTRGAIEVNGLGLFEKPKFEVDAERRASHGKAHQNVKDWLDDTGGMFSGHVSVGDIKVGVGDPNEAKRIFPETKTIETTVMMPPDMMPHMAAVFDERDRLHVALSEKWNSKITLDKWEDDVGLAYAKAMEDNPHLPLGPTLNALILPHAIENVRKQLANDTDAEKKS